GGQTKEKEKNRKEIFFNELLAPDEINRMFDPKVLTNWKRHTVTGEQEVTGIQRDESGLIRENLIIKGNNLIALHTLKEQFREKVKLIYIDPPYNTGNDSFGYNDNFNHSTWLTFEKNRLEAAKYFLSNSGSIWISIDEREFAYLKVLCDEIFGRENHISTVTVKVKDPAGVGQQAPIFDICEYLLVYAKNVQQFKENLPEFVDTSHFTEKANGYRNLIVGYGQPRLVKEIERKNVGLVKIYECEDYEIANANKLPFEEYVEKRKSIAADYNPSGGMILAIRGQLPAKGLSFIEYTPTKGKMAGRQSRVYFMNRRILSFLSEILIEIEGDVYRKSKLTNLWNIPNASLHLEGGVEFKNGKKPEVLLKKILSFGTVEGDLIMDFHVGSGTAAAVAHKMGRQYIGIEQMDYVKTITIERLTKVVAGESSGISRSVNWQGGGDFIYCELMPYNQVFMERIQSARSSEELLGIYRDMSKDSVLNWYIKPQKPEEAEEHFIAINDAEKQKQLLAELLDKNQLYVHLSEIEDETFAVSEADKALNRAFYAE
ncbi:MAG: site-specific DNA-methyltransferase, partial [Candidatus Poribacteria bacterium]|nr:site-specific DNA-methyltransferase [Candidatus Poribacteria bacterium]